MIECEEEEEREGGRGGERRIECEEEGDGRGRRRTRREGHKLPSEVQTFFHTIIFFPLNSSMMQDLPTSCPAPLCSGRGLRHEEGDVETLTVDEW